MHSSTFSVTVLKDCYIFVLVIFILACGIIYFCILGKFIYIIMKIYFSEVPHLDKNLYLFMMLCFVLKVFKMSLRSKPYVVCTYNLLLGSNT